MIPADIASSVKLLAQDLPAPVQPAQPARQVSDALSQLSAGQRIMAEIQSLLPNGMYRAVVAQRELTLALPFSAKPGDALELEVVESDGKLTLAFVANRGGEGAGKQESGAVATSLSQTGRLISDLLQEMGSQGKRAPPAILNTNAPITQQMPQEAGQLVPLLKQALTQSGVFYEAHQARWVAGELTTAQLRQEPQGQQVLAARTIPSAANPAPENSGRIDANVPQATAPETASSAKTPTPQAASQVASVDRPPAPNTGTAPPASRPETSTSVSAPEKMGTLAGMPREIAPIVQQQLDGLATQNFAWQGQIWPGQNLWWEIGEQGGEQSATQDPAQRQWRTRLKLDLPQLGGIDAQLQLTPAGHLAIQITTRENVAEQQLNARMQEFSNQLAAAGLALDHLQIRHAEEN